MSGDGAAATLRFAELVAARICHDLSSPLSIIASAAELARLEGERGVRQGGVGQGGEAMALMLEAGRDIAARVQFFRRLFGPALGPIAGGELIELAKTVLGGGRIAIEAGSFGGDSAFPAEAARAALAALVVAAEALPRGGTIRCRGEAADFALTLDGPAAAWPAHLTAVLGGAEPIGAALEGGARGLMGPFLVLAAAEARLRPTLLLGAGVPLLRLAAE